MATRIPYLFKSYETEDYLTAAIEAAKCPAISKDVADLLEASQ